MVIYKNQQVITGSFSPSSWTSEQKMDNVLEVCGSNEEFDSHSSVNNVSSDFFTSLNSIPNETGFKMAFLNIVSLPKKH
jgi:hypothetical protein